MLRWESNNVTILNVPVPFDFPCPMMLQRPGKLFRDSGHG